jgi:hypothetical protein
MDIGEISQIKNMTLRGLIGVFEGATQKWRYEVEQSGKGEKKRCL